MDLIFKKLSVSGFKSFQFESTLVFPKKSQGFYFLTGENKQSPLLGRNGAGKSSVWEALIWALYGKTSRGLKASSVVNWDDENDVCCVKLKMEVGGILYELTRTQSPNSLSLQDFKADNNTTVRQVDVDELLGIDFECFLQSVVIGQFSQFFFDYTPRDKLQLFQRVMGLERWVEHSDTAKVVRDEVHESVVARVASIKGSDNVLAAFADLMKNMQKDSANFLNEKGEKVKAIRHELGLKTSTLGDLNFELEKLLEASNFSAEKLEKKASKLRIRVDDCKRKTAGCEREIQTAEIEIEQVEKEVKRFKKCQGKCPYCNQEVTAKHLKIELERVKDSLSKLDNVHTSFVRKKQLLLDSEVAAVANVREAEQEISDIEFRQHQVSEKANSYRLSIKFAEKELKETQKRLQEAEAEENPYDPICSSYKKKIKVEEELVLTKRNGLRNLRKEEAMCDFWVKGFKDLRLWLIRECLTEYEIEVNNSLLQLGLEDWSVAFDVEREKKQEGFQKGLSPT